MPTTPWTAIRPGAAGERSSRRSGRASAAFLAASTLVASTLAASPGFATAAANDDPPALFVESAQAVGLDFVHFNGMVGKLYFPEVMSGGVALLDYDNDGDLDVYLAQGNLFEGDSMEDAVIPPRYPAPLTDRLYRNDLEIRPDGTRVLRFVDVTEEAKLAVTGYTMGIATGDFDNDGWIDIYLAGLGSNHLLRNRGDGTFEDVTAATATDDREWSVAASFFDYDRDGWLDLFIGNYVEFRVTLHKRCTSATGAVEYCGPLSYGPLPNRLLRNVGGERFANASATALLDNPSGTTLGLVAGDFDGDGWLDMYVANDQLANHLWINRRDGTFVDDALLAGAGVDGQGQPQASMGVVAGDLTGDGHEDLFMTHLRMEMNTLYVNDGSGLFTDQSADSGLGRASWQATGFGTALIDYDNDGIVDLYVANGAVKRIEAQLRAGELHPLHEPNALFRGLGGGRYQEVPIESVEGGAFSEVSRGVAAGDLDNDGDTDLIVTNNAGPVRVLINQVGQDRPWLGLRLLLAEHDRDALGAKVGLFRGGRPTQWRRVKTDGSYVSANDPRVLFGLGDGEGPGVVERVRVWWPDGAVEDFGPEAVAVGAYTTLRQGTGARVAQ
ncbi:MAG TPA: CRTAC1 family protein [Thermoanaerobaculia bacterium]|nr:CRTAC1 family protein [Thermoanaerobaculia bacterium]